MFRRLILLIFSLSGESRVVPDSETPTEENKVNKDNNNLLQNALPGSTGFDVSSTLDDPRPVGDFPSPEVLLKLEKTK